MLEAAVLVACMEAPCYGYGIASWLADEGLVTGTVSRGRLYETLATLTRMGALSVTDEASERGPDRRRYELTVLGRDRLRSWNDSLTHTGATLARLLAKMAALDVASKSHVGHSRLDTEEREGGEIMSCKCNCGGSKPSASETASSVVLNEPVAVRSVEERLATIENLLGKLVN
ncbi:PadR family transcriptional regulator [Ferrimicrobium sp.]|uniref:PadR family transcriptional regulator n=1 Tax=Ferrimicrobium sp. TaxID=2926050 RepID=UPI00262B1171|nr:PadR family transcriptional regulator [Ferrimicrobium sp.]